MTKQTPKDIFDEHQFRKKPISEEIKTWFLHNTLCRGRNGIRTLNPPLRYVNKVIKPFQQVMVGAFDVDPDQRVLNQLMEDFNASWTLRRHSVSYFF
ncbi:MAG: hypothetical protein OXC92_07050 [Flavobacteriaceae bacterium]|nr:hypothetical protein [Flavobacteriaceae bacterium]